MRRRLLLSERLYEALLYLYPKEFRAAFGRQMRLAFRDACHAAYQRKGAGGLLALWAHTVLDLVKSAPKEWARQGEITMSEPRLSTWAGPLTILVGALWLMSSIGDFVFQFWLDGNEPFLGLIAIPLFLSFVPMLFAVIGTRLRFHQSAGTAGRLGLALSVAGATGLIVSLLTNILLSGAAPEAGPHLWVNYAAVAGLLSIRIGYIFFGIDALRNRLLPRWNLLPLLLGLTVILSLPMEWFGVPAFLPPQYATPFLHSAITGACWLLLGVAITGRGRTLQPATL